MDEAPGEAEQATAREEWLEHHDVGQVRAHPARPVRIVRDDDVAGLAVADRAGRGAPSRKIRRLRDAVAAGRSAARTAISGLRVTPIAVVLRFRISRSACSSLYPYTCA